MTLEQLFDHAIEFGTKQFKHVGELRPMYIVETKDGERHPIPVSTTSPEQKDRLVTAMHLLFKITDVQRYVFMTEAWMLSEKMQLLTEADVQREYSKYPSLEFHPDRIEVLSFIAEDKAGNNLFGHCQILRPEHGKAKLAPLVKGAPSRTSGRMTGLLKD